MAIPKVILYYGFTPIADPAAVRLWQYDLCELLSLTGRIIISEHGINGTLGGSLTRLSNTFEKLRTTQDSTRLISNGPKVPATISQS